MKKWWALIGVLFAIIVVGLIVLVFVPAKTKDPFASQNATSAPATGAPSAINQNITVDTPAPDATIASPMTISGQALGSWYFEGTAPAALLDSNGSVIAQGPITANGDWTSPGFVPFSASLTFPAQPAGSTGTLVLTNDNPSGNPANQKTLDIPVTF